MSRTDGMQWVKMINAYEFQLVIEGKKSPDECRCTLDNNTVTDQLKYCI